MMMMMLLLLLLPAIAAVAAVAGLLRHAMSERNPPARTSMIYSVFPSMVSLRPIGPTGVVVYSQYI